MRTSTHLSTNVNEVEIAVHQPRNGRGGVRTLLLYWSSVNMQVLTNSADRYQSALQQSA